MQTLNSIVFGWYPYLCLTVFLFGSLFRFDREQYTWRTGSSQLLRRRQLMWGSNLFHVGILVIFVGHFVGLADADLGVRHARRVARLQADAGNRRRRRRGPDVPGRNFTADASAAVRSAHPRQFIVRRYRDPAVCCSRNCCWGWRPFPVSLGHLDGHEMVKFMAWAQGILTLQPGVAADILDVHPIFKAHLRAGHDDVPRLPVHAAGSRLERAGLVPRPPRLSGRPQP